MIFLLFMKIFGTFRKCLLFSEKNFFKPTYLPKYFFNEMLQQTNIYLRLALYKNLEEYIGSLQTLKRFKMKRPTQSIV